MRKPRKLASAKPCLFCKKLFHPWLDLMRRGQAKYCSVKCSNTARSKLVNVPTEELVKMYQNGLTIRQIAKKINAAWARVHQRLRTAIKLRPGGWRQAKGYLTTWDDSSGKRVRTGVHRAIARKMLQRPLQPGELIHHINGMKQDNRPENLAPMKRSQHNKTHYLLSLMALRLVRNELITYREGTYTFSSKMERLLKHV